MGMKIIIYSQK